MKPKRSPIKIVAAALAVAATVISWRYVFLPRYRPATLGKHVIGIDVSRHQGTIDWQRVANDEIQVAYLKASEGKDYADPMYQRNRVEAQKNNIEIGAYHFFTLCSPGKLQAAQFIREARLETLELPPAVDLELIGSCALRPPRTEVHQQVSDFVAEVERSTNRKVILYIGKSFDDRYEISTHIKRLRWELSFSHRPNIEWAIWQVHGLGKVDGIKGPVDLDLFDLQQLRDEP
jgi:lysozyme